MLDRDIMQVIAGGIIPDTYADEESPYVTEVREKRADGTDGTWRMQGLLEEDEKELLIEYMYEITGRQHPGWFSDSLFRMWRDLRGTWGGVRYQDWCMKMATIGIPRTSEYEGTAALQRHFLKDSDERTVLMKQRLVRVKRGEKSADSRSPSSRYRLPQQEGVSPDVLEEASDFFGGGRGRSKHSRN
jgi:hypothetical protein